MRERSRRKAISPIIATLILIVITVVAGVMLYGFVTGFMAKTSSSTGAVAQIAIDSAGVSSTGDNATIIVTNTGTTPVTITQVNLLNASTGAPIVTFTKIGTSPSPMSTSVTIAGGNTTTIYAGTPSSKMPSADTPVLVQVVTSTGSYAETSAVVGP
ncbi:MAG: archaellin/type IV pilin N-terminal domain-containing protein [Nitrososphaeria archaeon]